MTSFTVAHVSLVFPITKDFSSGELFGFHTLYSQLICPNPTCDRLLLLPLSDLADYVDSIMPNGAGLGRAFKVGSDSLFLVSTVVGHDRGD